MSDAGVSQAAKNPMGASAAHTVSSAGASPHPRDILLGAQAAAGFLPVCDHYSGAPARMRKSLQLQAEMTEEFGACVSVGVEHAQFLFGRVRNGRVSILGEQGSSMLQAAAHANVLVHIPARDSGRGPGDIVRTYRLWTMLQ